MHAHARTQKHTAAVCHNGKFPSIKFKIISFLGQRPAVFNVTMYKTIYTDDPIQTINTYFPVQYWENLRWMKEGDSGVTVCISLGFWYYFPTPDSLAYCLSSWQSDIFCCPLLHPLCCLEERHLACSSLPERVWFLGWVQYLPTRCHCRFTDQCDSSLCSHQLSLQQKSHQIIWTYCSFGAVVI